MSERVRDGMDAEEAIIQGAGIAIEGTARGVVGTAEMAYKVSTSRPVRFLGRGLKNGVVKLGEKFSGVKPER